MDYDLARAALDDVSDELTEEQFTALDTLIEMFKPYAGDDPDEAVARKPLEGHCPNCGLNQTMMFVPATMARVAWTALRLSICPRCHSTDMRMGRGPT